MVGSMMQSTFGNWSRRNCRDELSDEEGEIGSSSNGRTSICPNGHKLLNRVIRSCRQIGAEKCSGGLMDLDCERLTSASRDSVP